MTIPIEGEATYQGIPCLSAEFTATLGLTPNRGSVVVAARDLASLEIIVKSPLLPGAPLRSGGTTVSQYNANEGDIAPPADGVLLGGETIRPYGTLTFSSPQGRVYFFRLMPISIKPIKRGDDGMTLFKIELADVRHTWTDRGVLFGDFNHYQDNGEKILSTFRDDGDPFSLAAILRRISAQLPGVDNMYWATSEDARFVRDTYPRNISWRFERPARVLSSLLQSYDLHASLFGGEYLTVGARGRGLKKPSDIPDVDLAYADIRSWPNLSFAPDSVLVVGAPKIKEKKLALGWRNMVGLQWGTPDKFLIDAKQALASYQLTHLEAARWLLQTPEKQTSMMVWRFGKEGPKAAARLRSWLYRWYLIPRKQADTLPMRGLVSDDGEPLPPTVWYNTFTEVQWDDWVRYVTEKGIDPGAPPPTYRVFVNVRKELAKESEVLIDFKKGLIKLGGEQPPGTLRTEGIETLDQGVLRNSVITVHYSYEKKGKVTDFEKYTPYAVKPGDYFMFAVRRSGNNLAKANPLTLDSQPRVVRDSKLVQYTKLDGTSNKAELDEQAFTLAKSHFRGPDVEKTYEIKLAGFWYADVSSAGVANARYRMSATEATTSFVLNNYRHSADPMADTYADKYFADKVSRTFDPEGTTSPAKTSVGPNA